MDKRYRIVYFFDMKLITSTLARGIKNVKQSTILEALQAITKSAPIGKHYSYQKNSLHFYIADWKFDVKKNEYHVLVNKSDTNSADPTFSDVKKNKRREVAKNIGEGLDHSSHIIIKTIPEKPQTALLLLERGSLAGANNLHALFTRLISDAKNTSPEFYKQVSPENALDDKNNPININVHYQVEVDGHISTSFQKDLNSGILHEVILVSESEANTPIDTLENYIQKEKSETIKLNPTKAFSLPGLINTLKGKSNNYEKARVKFSHANGTDRDIEVYTETFTETNYVRRDKIESDSEFKSSYEKIDQTIINKMGKLI